jgi:A/G-specific adenine glycosylase
MVDVKGSNRSGHFLCYTQRSSGFYEDTDYQNPGDINQALIELGSTVCKVQNPSCGTCPLKDLCGAYQKSSFATQHSQDIQDIEDLCSVCEPLPTGSFDVTLLPMKAEKKKSREETDIVNVVEWRRSIDSEERWFLLVKRPEKGRLNSDVLRLISLGCLWNHFLYLGLLAGLDEFPTMSNVSDPDSKRHSAEGPVEVLSSVLASPVRRSSLAAKTDEECVESSDSDVRISQVKRVGDVLHIFSHVRKTYRSQWVLLEGGCSPPPVSTKSSERMSRNKTTKGKQKKAESTDVTPVSGEARWVSIDQVDHAK